MEEYKDDKYYRVKQKKPFNHTGFGIIIWLIFFYPVGLYYMFKNEVWNVKSRAIISLFFLFPVGIYMFWKHDLFNFITRVVVSSAFPLIIIIIILTAPSGACACQRYLVEMRDNIQSGSSYYSYSLQDMINCERTYGNRSTWADQCSNSGGKPARF